MEEGKRKRAVSYFLEKARSLRTAGIDGVELTPTFNNNTMPYTHTRVVPSKPQVRMASS